MKQKILTLTVVFVLCLGAGLAFRRLRHTDARKINAEIPMILNCGSSLVDKLEIERATPSGSTEHLSFVRTLPNGIDKANEALASVFAEWTMLAPVKTEAENHLLAALPSSLCDLRQEHPYEGPDSMAALGLEPVKTEINLQSGDQKWSMRLGTKTDSGHVIAAFANSTNPKDWKLFWVANKFDFLLHLPLADFQNRSLVKMNLDNIQSLKFSIAGKESFTLEREGDEWDVKQNQKLLGHGSEEAQKYVNRIGSLQAVGWEKMEIANEECETLKTEYLVELEGVAQRREVLRFTIPQSIKDSKEKRLIACNSARHGLYQIHTDMEQYLRTSRKLLIRK